MTPTEKNIIGPTGMVMLPDEHARLSAIDSYQLLDTLPEKDYDNITSLAANICNVPISLINLIDSKRIFMKSHYGLSENQAERDGSFCDYTIVAEQEIFIVRDARLDDRFKNSPIVKNSGIVFYAGVPLINAESYVLGTLCVFDTIPRELTNKQKQALISLAYHVVKLFESRRDNRRLLALQAELEENNQSLKNFAGTVSHDMKMPLANMILTSDIIRTKYGPLLDDQGKEYLNYIKQASLTLSDYITGLLEHYESDNTASAKEESFDSLDMFEEVIELLNIDMDCEINLPDNNIELHANKAALEQVLINLVSNSLKYNDKESIRIDIECEELDDYYHFKVSDNGIGINKKDLAGIFTLFATTDNLDRYGKKGNGIGLSTVKRLIKKLGGEIEVTSTLGEGTTFEFTIEKR